MQMCLDEESALEQRPLPKRCRSSETSIMLTTAMAHNITEHLPVNADALEALLALNKLCGVFTDDYNKVIKVAKEKAVELLRQNPSDPESCELIDWTFSNLGIAFYEQGFSAERSTHLCQFAGVALDKRLDDWNGASFLIVYDRHHLAAFLVWSRMPYDGRKTIFVWELFVQEAFRKQKLGMYMLHRIKRKLASDEHGIVLRCAPDNTVGHAFYIANEFRRIEDEIWVYGPKWDEFVCNDHCSNTDCDYPAGHEGLCSHQCVIPGEKRVCRRGR